MNLHVSKSIRQIVAGQPLILVVEDEEDNLLLSTQALEVFGYSYIGVTTGQAALSLTQQYQPALILLDLILPDLHGLEVVQRLRHNPKTAHLPVVALTAMAMVGDREKALKAGCSDYLSKPYSLDDLEAVINCQLQPIHSGRQGYLTLK
ncbi:response regulator [Leptolyngbya sp. FACHB-261]|uniref:response regulator n=1 Tax=Leptolyngbya sp. FACHB-261 TaxID=2692806 RepID=UPI00168A33E2|nr:response regulator [Leptolyngbya sp. FACHB-261]MBD2103132.1 response regulator [Leptolyngbya sp. FACHB-261]